MPSVGCPRANQMMTAIILGEGRDELGDWQSRVPRSAVNGHLGALEIIVKRLVDLVLNQSLEIRHFTKPRGSTMMIQVLCSADLLRQCLEPCYGRTGYPSVAEAAIVVCDHDKAFPVSEAVRQVAAGFPHGGRLLFAPIVPELEAALAQKVAIEQALTLQRCRIPVDIDAKVSAALHPKEKLEYHVKLAGCTQRLDSGRKASIASS